MAKVLEVPVVVEFRFRFLVTSEGGEDEARMNALRAVHALSRVGLLDPDASIVSVGSVQLGEPERSRDD